MALPRNTLFGALRTEHSLTLALPHVSANFAPKAPLPTEVDEFRPDWSAEIWPREPRGRLNRRRKDTAAPRRRWERQLRDYGPIRECFMIAVKRDLAGTAAVNAGQHRRWWQPHIWAGCSFPAWMRLLARYHFAIHWSQWLSAFLISFWSLFNSALGAIQQAVYGRRIRRTRIRQAPVFIIGHWRSGTTLLHEFLSLDERHASPTTYACMAPNHFLLTESFFTRWLSFLTPSFRPMDNMAAGFDRPQEDEFALCMLGEPSPYWTIAFPNVPPRADDYLDLESLPPQAVAEWKRTFLRFLTELTCKDDRRLILKSPTYSCRIKTLLELFPDARFVHIVRDPYVIYSSTLKLWKSLYADHALQKPTLVGLQERVLADFVRLDQKIDEGQRLVRADRFHLVRYEDLVRDPVNSMRDLYKQLDLGQFDRLLPRLEKHLTAIADYRTNRYQLSGAERRLIDRRWGRIIKRHGYGLAASVAAPLRRAVLVKSAAATSLSAREK
jgi:omega-hydroxy-beta-dihydromenaquinone-9 sulfotransferase